MATSKVTFTLDQATLTRLQDASARLAKSRSAIVREAILDFHDRLDRLSERERVRLLKAFDEYVTTMPLENSTDVDREIAEIRRSRRAGGRRANRRIKA